MIMILSIANVSTQMTLVPVENAATLKNANLALNLTQKHVNANATKILLLVKEIFVGIKNAVNVNVLLKFVQMGLSLTQRSVFVNVFENVGLEKFWMNFVAVNVK